jgi:hypothetical protein
MTDQTTEADVVDGTAEPDEAVDANDYPEAGALEVYDQSAGAIIRAYQPREILAKAQQIAVPLRELIDGAGLAKSLDKRNPDRKHIEVGGWQATGAMLGALGGQPLHAETVWTKPLRDPDTGALIKHDYLVKTFYPKSQGGGLKTEALVTGHDWEAKVEVRTPDGTIVGSAEAMCSRGESTWRDRDEYAVRSMAETRAESRAYRRAIGWIVSLAKYNPTPAEELGHTPGADDTPAGLEAASEALQGTLMRALTELFRGSEQDARAVFNQIGSQWDMVPKPVAQGIVFAVLRMREIDARVEEGEPAPAPASDVPSDTNGTVPEVAAPADPTDASAAGPEGSASPEPARSETDPPEIPFDEPITDAQIERLIARRLGLPDPETGEPQDADINAGLPASSVPEDHEHARALCICDQFEGMAPRDRHDDCPIQGHGMVF